MKKIDYILATINLYTIVIGYVSMLFFVFIGILINHPWLTNFMLTAIFVYTWLIIVHELSHWLMLKKFNAQYEFVFKARHHYNPGFIYSLGNISEKQLVIIGMFPIIITPIVGYFMLVFVGYGVIGISLGILFSIGDFLILIDYFERKNRITSWYEYIEKSITPPIYSPGTFAKAGT